MRTDRGNRSKEDSPDWCCPTCQGRLDALRCTGCGAAYPRAGGLPILLADARNRLSVWSASVGARRRTMSEEIVALAPDRIDPRVRFRLDVLEKRRQGLRRMLAIADAELADLLDGVVRSGGPLANEAAKAGSLTGDSSLLFTDWGQGLEGEREVSRIVELARESAGDLSDDDTRASSSAPERAGTPSSWDVPSAPVERSTSPSTACGCSIRSCSARWRSHSSRMVVRSRASS